MLAMLSFLIGAGHTDVFGLSIFIKLYSFFFFLVVLGFELRASCLLSRHCAT
jgi:hypothetical protein